VVGIVGKVTESLVFSGERLVSDDAQQKTKGKTADDAKKEAGAQLENVKRPVNKFVAIGTVVMLCAVAASIFFAFKFVEDERARSLQEWQVRLGIVADSRSAAVNDWLGANFKTVRELAETYKSNISTIQRVYSILRGEPELDEELDEHSAYELATEPVPVEYNPAVPPETFDVLFLFGQLAVPVIRVGKDWIVGFDRERLHALLGL